ncbi:unnamed protein product [Rhizopus stolonifer]
MLEYGNDKTWDPIYLELSRCSYLPLMTTRIQTLLLQMDIQIPERDFESIWYEYDNEPLKWHYPIGLSYNLHSHTITLPWSITIHFKNLPTNLVLAKPTETTMQNMFMSMVKEADFLRTGSTKKVMNLSKHDQIQLWQSLSSDKYDDFWKVNKQLVEYAPSNRHVPIRLYLPDNCPVIQELVDFHNSDNLETEKIPTIAETVISMVPELSGENISIISHGISLPLETPIHWAYVNLCFADNFLHFVITLSA